MCVLIDERFDGNSHKEPRDSLPCHPLSGSAIECDGLEDLPSAHTIGSASSLAPELRGRVGDKLRDEASSVAVWCVLESKRRLDGFKELPDQRLGKTEH